MRLLRNPLQTLGTIAAVGIVMLATNPTALGAASQVVKLLQNDQLTTECPTALSVQQLDSQRATVTCAAAVATATPAAQATPTPNAGVAGIPACTHYTNKWHGLVELNDDGSIQCTYGHEHKDDPNVLSELFGPLKYGEISYPWETHLENQNKHNVYGWMVAKDQRCFTKGHMAGNTLSLTDFRLQVHNDGNMGAATRWHSYFLQANVCDMNDPTYQGKITIGGHMDYGRLYVRVRSASAPGFTEVHVPLPADTALPLQPSNLRRLHGSREVPIRTSTWYGSNGTRRDALIPGIGVELGVGVEDWGPVDRADPTKVLFYGGDRNGSHQEIAHVVGLRVPAELDATDGAKDGYVTYAGHADRYGNVVQGCTAPGPDCVPIKLERMKVGGYIYRNDEHENTTREYDVKGPDGTSLIRFPN